MNGQVEFKADGLGDGGHAFPQPGVYDASRDQVNPVGAYYDAGGMTLRDYFAGQELSKVNAVSVCDIPSAYDRAAEHCYRMADAMLKVRSA